MELMLITRSIYGLHGYGGMERHCFDWIQWMVKLGCKVHVVTTTPSDPLFIAEFPKEAAFYFLPGKPARRVFARITYYPGWVRRIEAFIEQLVTQISFTAIYAHGLAAAACQRVQVPVYYNPHGMEEFKCGGLKYLAYTSFRNLNRKAAQSAQRIIATDKTLVNEIIRFFNVSENRIIHIPNAVDCEGANSEHSEMQTKFSGLNNADPLLLGVGRLEPNKGFDVLIRALARIPKLQESWKLILVGNGSQLDNLKRLTRQYALDDRIMFSGELPENELITLYKKAHLFVNPTLYEGSSLVTLEAMKYGLPVVASNTGGLPDKVIPNDNGWLVSPGDPKALAETVQQACANRHSWHKMGESSKKIVQSKYSWKVVSQQYINLFQNKDVI